jgi:hypothetical protein
VIKKVHIDCAAFRTHITKVNKIVEDRISDHRPMIIDLPLAEPPLNEKRRIKNKKAKAFNFRLFYLLFN